ASPIPPASLESIMRLIDAAGLTCLLLSSVLSTPIPAPEPTDSASATSYVGPSG
ncbi:hypothetical protein H0H93_013494, partial [Arthromyces matolae]